MERYDGHVSISDACDDLDISYRRQANLVLLRSASAQREDAAADALSDDLAISDTFLRLLHAAPLHVQPDRTPIDRLSGQLRAMLLLLADEPRVADLCLRAMLASDAACTCRRIGAEVHRRIRAALGSGAWPEIVDVVEFALYGAVMEASLGVAPFDDVADRLTGLVAGILAPSGTAAP